MEYAQYSEAPNIFHFWTGVSTVAGSLRRRVWIDQKYFMWTPNFFVVFVAPPGIVQKSTTAGIGMNLLRRVPNIHFGPNSVTWQALVQSFQNATEAIDLPDNTIISQSALTIESSEFGTFLDPQDRVMVDVLVELWDGRTGVWEKRTKSQGGESISNPWINLIACTTPDWIAGNFPQYMIGGGFMSRTIFVYADEKRQYIAYPKDHIPEHFDKMGDLLVEDLEHISKALVGEYTLTNEAKKWGEVWYEALYRKKDPALDDERFASYFARKQTHVHKLAMVIAASCRDDLIIEQEDLEQADGIMKAVERDMPKVFSRINSPEARSAQKIVDLTLLHPGISSTDAYRSMFHTVTYSEFYSSLQGAINSGQVKQRQVGTELKLYPGEVYGKPSNAKVSNA